jgi:hypothetical protein
MLKCSIPQSRYMCFVVLLLWPTQVLAGLNATASPFRREPSRPPYPVTADAASIVEAYAKPMQWDGRAVALEGTVNSVIFNSRGQPSIELELARAGDTTIWATWPLTEGHGSVP